MNIPRYFLIISVSFLLSLSASRGAAEVDTQLGDDLAVKKEVRVYIDGLDAKIQGARKVTLFIIAPRAVEGKTSKKTFIAPGGEAHEIFDSKELHGEDATLLKNAIIRALHAKADGIAMCFDPAHGIALEFPDDSSFHMAVCLHCNDMSFDLPSDKFKDGYSEKDIGDAALPQALWKLAPLPEDFEKRFFGFTTRELEQRAIAVNKAYVKWSQAAPSSLRPALDDMNGIQFKPSAEMLALLEKEYPAKADRVMALFKWYGNGQGQWSGFPSYESIPAGFLFEYPTPELLEVVETRSMTADEIAGVARFFADWDFGRQRPNDRKLISDRLCSVLLKATLKGSNEDNKARAIKAFEREEKK